MKLSKVFKKNETEETTEEPIIIEGMTPERERVIAWKQAATRNLAIVGAAAIGVCLVVALAVVLIEDEEEEN